MRNCEKRKEVERKMERLRGKGKDEEKGERENFCGVYVQ